jgi:hypothetical protein
LVVSVASRIDDAAYPVELAASPLTLDRSNDGQDHTVLPYAEFALRHSARRRGAPSRRDVSETNHQRRSSARSRLLTGFIPPCNAHLVPDAAASTATGPAISDDVRSPSWWAGMADKYDKYELR